MKSITKIDEVRSVSTIRKTRVAAYARVSTSSDEQILSLDMQKEHYESYIRSNDEWEYAGLYFDEGISGTSMRKRDGLKKLVDDCDKGLIDIVPFSLLYGDTIRPYDDYGMVLHINYKDQ